jgi:hypothetical protein
VDGAGDCRYEQECGLPLQVSGTNLAVYNALTDQPLAVKKVIPYKTHYLIDVGNVALLALLTLHKDIRSDKRALRFHLGLIGLAALNILILDWKAKN